MADLELDINNVFTLKVDELKNELAKRGLTKSGNKADLQMRLLQCVNGPGAADTLKTDDTETETETLDETTEDDEELKKELEESLEKLDTPTAVTDIPILANLIAEKEITEPTSDTALEKTEATTAPAEEKKAEVETILSKEPEKPIAANATVLLLTEEKRRENRGKRFGGAVSTVEKKKSRSERFSTSSVSTGLASGLSKPEPITEGDKVKINKRAERFGAISSLLTKPTEEDRVKQRQERFVDDRIKKRQERFGVVQVTKPTSNMEARKQQRALKFGIK